MMPAVLPVDGAVDVQAIVQRMQQGVPPADVHEYLWRVRIEAEGIPDVVVSDVDPRQFDNKQTANMPAMPSFADTVDAALLPSDEWKRALLADFAELRQLIARWQELGAPATETQAETETEITLETTLADSTQCNGSDGNKSLQAYGRDMHSNSSKHNSSTRHAHIRSNNTCKDNSNISRHTSALQASPLRTDVPRMSDIDGWRTFFFGKRESQLAGTPPHLRLLLQFDQVLTRRLLEHHAEWLEDETALSRARGVWIYALLARLDKPVHAGVAATIRQLLRRCWQLRSELDVADASAVAATSLELKALNVLICITGDFFGQLHEQA